MDTDSIGDAKYYKTPKCHYIHRRETENRSANENNILMVILMQLRTHALPASAHLSDVLLHHLDHVGHREVHDVVPPRQLEDHVRVEQVVALEEAGGEALVVLLVEEPRQQLLRDVSVTRLGGVLHRVLKRGRGGDERGGVVRGEGWGGERGGVVRGEGWGEGRGGGTTPAASLRCQCYATRRLTASRPEERRGDERGGAVRGEGR